MWRHKVSSFGSLTLPYVFLFVVCALIMPYRTHCVVKKEHEKNNEMIEIDQDGISTQPGSDDGDYEERIRTDFPEDMGQIPHGGLLENGSSTGIKDLLEQLKIDNQMYHVLKAPADRNHDAIFVNTCDESCYEQTADETMREAQKNAFLDGMVIYSSEKWDIEGEKRIEHRRAEQSRVERESILD
eukprot:Nk52_evm2s620 gene=Nk52_evmTU2s620